jgi:hypothetical protein
MKTRTINGNILKYNQLQFAILKILQYNHVTETGNHCIKNLHSAVWVG